MKAIYLSAALFFGVGICSEFQAQEESSNKVKITITQTEDGETTTTTSEYESDGLEELLDLLQDEGLLDGVTFGEPGEQVEVIIRKKGGNDSFFEFNMDAPQSFGNGNSFFFQQHDKGDQTGKGFLGVHCEGIENDSGKGIRVVKVVEGSAAEAAGLQADDVITAIEGEPVSDCDELVKLITAHESGNAISVDYERAGSKQTAEATLGKRKFEYMQYSFNGEDREFDDFFDGDHSGMSNHFFKVERSNKPFLGVAFEMTQTNDDPSLITVNEVYEGSTAAEMGIREGDVLKKINGEEVSSSEALISALSDAGVDDPVSIEVEREGEAMTFEGQLKKRSEVPSASAHSNVWKWNGSSLEDETRILLEMEELSKEEAADLSSKSGTDITASNDLQMDNLQFSPNPNNGVFKLSFNLSRKGDTSVELFDVRGNQVYMEILPKFTGDYQKEIDISERPNGVYVLKVSQRGKQFTQKVVKSN